MARSGHTLIIEGGREGVGKVDLAEEPAFSSSPSSLGPHSWPPPSIEVSTATPVPTPSATTAK